MSLRDLLGRRRRKGRAQRAAAETGRRRSLYFRHSEVEQLEQRTLLSAGMQFDHVVVTQGPANEVTSFMPAGSSVPPAGAFNPAQIKQAYGIDQVKDNGVLQDGTGETIAIIDAYDNPMFVSRNGNADVNQDPNFLASDLHKFDVQYGLPEPAGFFTKVDQTGGTTYPSGDTGWGTEIALDVEWVHALAPGAKIILIEANSNSESDLLNGAAVWARDHSGAQVVTMSFGGNESSGDPSSNSIFQSPADHGITWLASTGDDGVPGGYPAFSPNVVAVGGTTLTAPGGVYSSETGWSGSGGGISSYETQPSYQQGLVVHSGTSVVNQNGKRTIPDVAFDADLNSGVAVYDSYSQGSTYPWLTVGGTSFSSPAWAAMIGITDEIRANHGLPSLDGRNDTLPALYQIYSDPNRYSFDFHDITTGSNGYSAAAGYDLVTGMGTPKASTLLADLAGVTGLPTVSGTTPSLTGGTALAGTTTFAINFNKLMVGAGTASNYALQSVGPDGLLGTADDAIVPLTASYNAGVATLTVPALAENVYRLTVRDTITDQAGNPLDGNRDGIAGGNWTTDFVVVSSNTSPLSPATTFGTGGIQPVGVTAGDFNEDGKIDLAVANCTSGTVGILLNNGSGGFLFAGTYSSGGSAPYHLATADFNHDGHLDLVVANASSNSVGILLGNGSGGFSTARTFNTGGSYPTDIAVADFNADGNADVAVTNLSGSSVGIFFGDGAGGLSSVTTVRTPVASFPEAITAGDFNGDGNCDLAVDIGNPNTVEILLSNGHGGFSVDGTLNGVTGFNDIAAGDFNNDGKTDLVTVGSMDQIQVFLGDGTGGFTGPTTSLSSCIRVSDVAVGDFNRDGNLDLAVMDRGVNTTPTNTVEILLGDGSGNFSVAGVYGSGATSADNTCPDGIAVGDFNGDGKPDVAVTNYLSNSLSVLLNVGDLAPVTLSSAHGLLFDVAVGNFGAGEIVQGSDNAFDGDGRLLAGGTLFQPSTATCTMADSGQSVVTAAGTATGLTVSREITVPNAGSDDFARTIDSFTNSTGSTITTTVTIVGNLGSDTATKVFATSDGTDIVSPDDQWIGTDDASDGGGTPAVIHVIHGPASLLQPKSASVVNDNITWTYNLTVPAGQTVRLAYFTIVATTRAAAIASANALVTPSGFGGQAAAFLSPVELQSLVNYISTNNAPVVIPAEPQGTTDEDTPLTVGLSGTFINNGRGTTTITDPDPGAIVGGIAVVGTTGRGTWSYSLDGSTFYPVGAVNNGLALLLPGTAQLRYTPDMMNGETATITYRAWDMTYASVGVAGTKVDTTINGGTSPFSSATDTASLIVTDVNDAPVLTPATPSLGGSGKDTPLTLRLSGTFINHGPGTTTITDVDHGDAVGGIALMAATGNGAWSYSLDGTTFSPAGTVSANSALLLPNTAELCYTPDGIHSETATVTYCAWDASAGAPGTLADATINGGTTAFSLATDTASLSVNDAPVLSPASPSLGTTDQNTALTLNLAGTFINNGPGTTTISDVDSGAIVGGIALVGTTGRGAWSYSLDGSAFSPVGTVSSAAALLLPSTAQLRYTPDLMNGETATITYRAWDTSTGSAGSTVDTSSNGGTTAFSVATDTATLTVTDVNNAPVLMAASPSLGITNQATPVTIPLAGTFINHGSGTTTITDADRGAIVGGIAITGTTGLHAWSYSLDNSNFYPLGAVSNGSALLLPSTAELRYAPDGVHSETATVTYRAWDMTTGTAGAYADTSNNGGTTAFSLATDTASLAIDYTPPRVSSTSPSLTGGTFAAGTTTLAITFSEAVTGGGTAANYLLQGAGPDGLLGTADDIVVPLTVSYSGATATLALPPLPENVYRLTVHDTLVDLAGNKLDGNGDGTAGGDWVTDFVGIPNSRTFPNLTQMSSSSPQSVAIGDFNGDGIPDLAAANYVASGTVEVFLGDGKGGFSDAGTFGTGGSHPWAVAAGDLNRDGKLDLIVTHSYSNTVGVLLGNGNGTFGTATTFSSGGSSPEGLVVADFNGDGKLDVAVANEGSNTVGVLLGNGSGGLGNAATFGSGDLDPSPIAVADFDGDGKLDLVVGSTYDSKVSILKGTGSGSFSVTGTYSTGAALSPYMALAVGDFNNDGKADVVATNFLMGTVGVLLGTGNGSLGTAQTFSTGMSSSPQSVVVADFNGDGKADLGVGNVLGGVGVLLNTGGGTFSTITEYYWPGCSYNAMAVGDFNGDGRPDVAGANGSFNSVDVLLNFGGPSPVTLSSPHSLPFDIAVGGFGAGELIQGSNNAFDGDGRLMVGGAPFRPATLTYTTADSGRSIVTAAGAAAGLSVSRKITVPNTGSDDFSRTIDAFTNSTGSAIITTVTIIANLGSNAATNVFATSDGTGVVSPNDLWIGTDDASDGSGTPAVIHYIRGPGATKPTSVAVVGDNIEWTYNLTVPAGQTVRLGYFTIVATTRAAAVASANALVTPSGFGGQAAAFLSPAELQSLVNFTNKNQAPVLAPASPTLGTTNEDTAATIGLSGTFINNGPGTTTITDADPGAVLGGIAVVGTTGRGTWSYSLDGSTFYPIGAVSTAAALLLPSTAQLCYTPDMMNGETATITYRAWDATYGTPGTTVDTTINGGTTAFSSATDTASLVVTDVNDAPVLTPAAPLLGATTKSAPITLPLLGTFINHGAGTTVITDVDHGAIVGGIALTAATGDGTWSYSLDGTTFVPLGTVSASSALLLPNQAQLGYAPSGIGNEQPTITYHAWDATVGKPGTLADVTNNGGTTAFSSTTDTATLLVNDAPVLTPASPSLGTTDENTAITINLVGTFINHGPGTTTVSDIDPGTVLGGIALMGTTGHGTWSYSLDGTSFNPVATVSSTAALLLPNTAELRYTPDLMNGETATITYRAWDASSGSTGSKVDTSSSGGPAPFSIATDIATLVITDLNDAPLLIAASPSLGLTNQTTPVTIPLTGTFLNHGAGTTAITDVDHGAVIGGIALVGTTGLNAWSYSLDGTTFSPVGTVSGSSALLLPSTAQFRYTPDGVHSEAATITYRAWDMTSGTTGAYADTTNSGGSTAFSLATDTASLTIDYTPPRVTGTTPVLTGGTLGAGTSTLAITFSEAVTGGGTAANYQLQNAGPDGLLGTADDVIVPLTASYAGNTATLTFPVLRENVYRLTVYDSLTDLAGNKLDGNSDGVPGGDWVADFVALNSGNTPFIGPTTALSAPDPSSTAMGDFNGDGHADLAVASYNSGTVAIFLGDGNGGFSSAGTVNTGAYNPYTVAVADLNRDGKLDLIVVDNDENTVDVLLGNGNGTFGTAATYSTGGLWPEGLAVGDFNGDGKLDVATANWDGDVGVLLGNGSGGFGTVSIFPTGSGRSGGWPDALAAGDFNGDGKLDLAVANEFTDTVAILLGNGGGSFGTATTFSSGGYGSEGIAVGDFNGDGKTDVAVTNADSNTLGILLGNGSGGFGTTTTFSTGNWPSGVAVADFNADGKADLAVANEGDNTVTVFSGNGAGSFSAATVSSGGSDPQGVIAGDLDGDGRPDLVVGNANNNAVAILMNTSGPAPVVLNSSNNLPFDIAVGRFGPGELIQGYNNAFDGDGRLMVGGAAFQPSAGTLSYTMADSGQSVVTASGTAAGLTISRKVTVPNTGSDDFARTIDSFTNSTGSTITTTVTIVGNLGSDAATNVFATSDGTGIVSPNDLWIGTDDASDGSGTPAVIHYIHGPLGLRPSSVSVIGDNIEWTYNLTVPAGQTVRLESFTIVATTRAAAIASANALVTPTGFGGQAAAFLSPSDLGSLANFAFPTLPEVTKVAVSGSSWTSSSLAGGYAIPVGSGAQLVTLPWGNINQIVVTFNENVTVDQSDLLLTGINVPSYDVSDGTFSYDPSTFTATWTLPKPIGPDKLMLALNASGSDPIEDAAGNRLDGEWTNPTSTTATGTNTYPSGNGVAGGNFDFRFNVLPGDANQDGSENFSDLSRLLANYGQSTGESWGQGDFNGDGAVNFSDLSELLAQYGQSLPSGEPAAGMFSAGVTLIAGTTMYIPLNSTDAGHTVTYTVTASDYSKLTPTIMPSSNKTLQFNVLVNGVTQTMDFQLFDNLAPNTTARIEQLVNSGFYNGLQIYRNAMDGDGNPFVIQGGNDPPTGAIKTNQSSMPEEFNPDLQYTSAGMLAMARPGAANSSSTEFFITEEAARFLDYNYTIFGFQTAGMSVDQAIAAMADEGSTQDPIGIGYLVNPVTISSASIITDTQNGVLELRAPAGATGTVTVTVTVTASDGTNTPTTQSFTVTIQPDSTSSPANPFASVVPATPTGLTYLPPSGGSSQSTNLNNSTSETALQFQVSGVTSGNLVEILADGNVIGQATAAGSTVVVTTNGSTELSNGSHSFTAIQVAPDQTVTVDESDSSSPTGTTAESKTADVPSLDSAAVWLTVNTTMGGASSTQSTGGCDTGTAVPMTVTFSQPVTASFSAVAPPVAASVSAAVSIAVTVPSENSTSLEPTQNQAASNLADQARAHDAVLAGEPAVPSPSEASWLSDVAAPWSSRRPASDLDRPTDAVDDMLATYNGESLDV